MAVYISGSLAHDRIMVYPGLFADSILPEKVHMINVSFLIESMRETRGGTAGNIAYSMALLGEQPIILSSAGKDFGEYAAYLKTLGLSVDGVRILENEHTAFCYITTDMSDNQIVGFCLAAMKHPCGYKFGDLDLERDLAIVAPGNMDDMQNLPCYYREKGLRYIYDPSQQVAAFSGQQMLDGLTGSYVLICNDYELEVIMNKAKCSKAELTKRTGHIITTLGDKGCLLTTIDKEVHLPALPAKVKDPTGAGDALRGGLLCGLHNGRDMLTALQMGVTAASFCVEANGTQEHFFDQNSFAARYQQAFGEL